ncbi:MAG: PKD domain-containing protein [Methanoregula sp.]
MKIIKKLFVLLIIVAISSTVVFFIDLNSQSKLVKDENSDHLMRDLNRMISSEKISLHILAPTGSITIQTTVSDSPPSLRVYKGLFYEGDKLDIILGNSLKKKSNVISSQDAPESAINALAQYGGLPSDAELGNSRTTYLEKFEPSTGETVESTPLYTGVYYHRLIDGMPVGGQSDKINVELGENGTVLRIYKIWRTLEYTGRNASIISPAKAVDRLQNGEILNPPLEMNDISIHTIKLGYYEKSRTDPEITLEPIWIFYGNTSSGSAIDFYVYARQFSNFTATPTSGKVPLNVTFTDTSDASPSKWLWDFGDGTNSTVQNPVHRYTAAGTCNVSLKVWNDLGSDTMEKPFYITVRLPSPPVANFTGSPTSGVKPLKVSFNDSSTNEPAGWRWTFGDGTHSTNRHPVHTYTSAGNFTVSLNVTNSDGSNSTVKTRYIHVSSQPPTTTPTTTPTTQPTTTATTPPTTRPTPRPTRQPLSSLVAIAGLAITGLVFAAGKK